MGAIASVGVNIPDVSATELEEIRAGGIVIVASIAGLTGHSHDPESPCRSLLALITGSVEDAGAITTTDMAAIYRMVPTSAGDAKSKRPG